MTVQQLEYLRYRRLRAPREDGQVHIEPPLAEVPELVAANRRQLAALEIDLHGRTLSDLQAAARRDLLQRSVAWTRSYHPGIPQNSLDASAPLILAGHQPRLFHPGVWFKNFALDAVARRVGGTAVNLIVDSDDFAGNYLRVPGGTLERPVATHVPFDALLATIPFEERGVVEPSLAEQFPEKVVEETRDTLPGMMLPRFWEDVLERLEATGRWGAAFAQARHRTELRWGLSTLEVPQSAICSSEPFAWFATYLLLRLEEFAASHNHALDVYRAVHRARSSAQPVPNLLRDADRLEAPFWVWTAEQPNRRRLFVERRDRYLVLSDGGQWQACLPLGPGDDLRPAAERWLELADAGVRLRSRALITTLWARLALGDLFLHGIGGAKYDQVTDAIMADFFGDKTFPAAPYDAGTTGDSGEFSPEPSRGIRPPRYMILSATVLLPVSLPAADPAAIRDIDEQLRRLIFQPDRYLQQVIERQEFPKDWSEDDIRQIQQAIAEKWRWIRTPVTAETARPRFLAIRRINEQLQPYVEPRRRELQQARSTVDHALRARSILGWREYAFCLYPEQKLRQFYRQCFSGE